jgi:hypothetical protein
MKGSEKREEKTRRHEVRSNDSKRGIKQVSPLPVIDAVAAWPHWKGVLGSNQFHSTNIHNQLHSWEHRKKTDNRKILKMVTLENCKMVFYWMMVNQ